MEGRCRMFPRPWTKIGSGRLIVLRVALAVAILPLPAMVSGFGGPAGAFAHTSLATAAVSAAHESPAGDARASGGTTPITLEPRLFKELSWRAVGPTNMGGRISDFAVVENRTATFFM